MKLAGLVAAALVAALATTGGTALADVTIGHTGTPRNDRAWSPGTEIADLSAAVGAGGGTITSFNTQASDDCMGTFVDRHVGVFDPQVLRPLGSNQYTVIGHAGDQTDTCDSQPHSYPVNIPVQAGDVLGAYVVAEWIGVLQIPGEARNQAFIPQQPGVGDTVTLPSAFTDLGLDLSATLVPSLPTSKAQCKNNGWQTFGTSFKSEGACVSFVTSGRG